MAILCPWIPIRDPNMHGVYRDASNGRRAEVVRAYAGDWRLFAFSDGAPTRDTGEKSQFDNRSSAMRAATRWLQSND